MRLHYLLIPFILVLAADASAFDGKKKIGIGVIAGDQDDITDNYRLSNNQVIDFGSGRKISGDKGYQIFGDHLIFRNGLIEVPEGNLQLYFGGGARFITYSDDNDKNKNDEFGLSIPVGIEYLFWKPQLGAFLELVPVLCLTADTEFEFGSGIGLRLFF